MADELAIRQRIKEIMVERLRLSGLDPGMIDDEATFEWLDIDSVDALELVVALEKEYAIKVKNEDLQKESFESVAALAALVSRYLAAKEDPPAHGET